MTRPSSREILSVYRLENQQKRPRAVRAAGAPRRRRRAGSRLAQPRGTAHLARVARGDARWARGLDTHRLCAPIATCTVPSCERNRRPGLRADRLRAALLRWSVALIARTVSAAAAGYARRSVSVWVVSCTWRIPGPIGIYNRERRGGGRIRTGTDVHRETFRLAARVPWHTRLERPPLYQLSYTPMCSRGRAVSRQPPSVVCASRATRRSNPRCDDGQRRRGRSGRSRPGWLLVRSRVLPGRATSG